MWWERERYLNIQNNNLFIADQSVSKLAQIHGTPLYIYSLKRIIDNYQLLIDALSNAGFKNYQIHYAIKANHHSSIVETIHKLGGGIDASSPGEVAFARENGFDDSMIICTGTSLSNPDLEYLANTDVIINFDSVSALKRFKAREGQKIGLRINTGVGAGRTEQMTTGGTNVGGLPVKFGLPMSKIFEALEVVVEKQLQVCCIHHHVGSDWLDDQIDNYFLALNNLLETSLKIQTKLGYEIPILDLGGGFGVRHSEHEEDFPFHEFFRKVAQYITESTLSFSKIIIEPGNSLVGNAGILVVQVNTVEEKNGYIFVGVDTGLNVFNSPALYGIYHEIVVCNQCSDAKSYPVTVVGNICESGDIFATNRKLSLIKEGDYLAILNAGAYGSVMSSTYNLRPKAKEFVLE